MTYIEHAVDCNIFKDDRLIFGGGFCNCPARYARAPQVMGPHEETCPYTYQPAGTRVILHGICYCGANPTHDNECRKESCPFWERRSGVKRIVMQGEGGGVLILPADMVA